MTRKLKFTVAGCIVIAAYSYASRVVVPALKLARSGQHTLGLANRIEGKNRYHVAFELDGQTFAFDVPSYCVPFHGELGAVGIVYDPQQPSVALLEPMTRRFLHDLTFAMAGLLSLALGFFLTDRVSKK